MANNDPHTISHFFDLLQETRKEYNIAADAEWNIDKKGFIMGMSKGAKVI